MGCLYRLKFASGKSYIGITEMTAERRYRYHLKLVRKRQDLAVYRAWAKHGHPLLITLARGTGSYLRDMEMRAIKSYGTFGPGGYNLTPGGEFCPFNLPHVRARITAASTGRRMSPETRAKISAAKRGVKMSAPRSAQARKNLSAALMGHVLLPETKAKISAARKARSAAL